MSRQNVNVADVNMGNANNPTTFIMCNISEKGSPEVWYLDSGCSNHMSGIEFFFFSLIRLLSLKLKLKIMEPFP